MKDGLIVLSTLNAGEFRDFLIKHGVPVDSYGKGETKTIKHLYNEVQLGECTLSVEDGKVVRSTNVLCLDICKGDFVLSEEKQIFTCDGRSRKRDLESSTGEKMMIGEDPVETAERLVREEMPFAQGYPISFRETKTKISESQSFPGITTHYVLHFCEVSIPAEEIPDVVVVEADKSVYYRWKRR